MDDLLEIDSNYTIQKYLSQMDNYSSFLLEEEKNSEWVHDILKRLEVKFKNIDERQFAPELFDFIYENNLYEINFKNIKTILNEKLELTSLDQKLNESNLSTILESKCNVLINYIEIEIKQYIENVFLTKETNTDESESTLNYLLNQEEISIDDKKRIINQTKINTINIDSIPTELWDFVLDNNKLLPNWSNVYYHYTEKEKINKSLIQFLNNKESFSQLSKIKIDDEITEEESYKLSESIMLCEDISIDGFDNLVLSFPYQFAEVEFDDLNKKKVEILIKNGIIALNEVNTENLKETFPKLYVDLLIVNKEKFLENLDSFSLNLYDFTYFLFSSKLNNSEKIKIINHQDYEDISIMDSTANRILQILGKPDFEVNHYLLEELVKNTKDVEKLIVLINTQIEYLDNREILELLTHLPQPYSKITKGNPRIINKSYTDEFLQNLKTRRIISSVKPDKDELIAFKKQKRF